MFCVQLTISFRIFHRDEVTASQSTHSIVFVIEIESVTRHADQF